MKQRITEIQEHQTTSSHHLIHFDNNHHLIIPSVLIGKFGLRIGLEIEAHVIEKLIAADEAMRAKTHAITLLRDNIYSKTQMTLELENAGFSEEIIQNIIIELIQSGNIRDRQYAVKWVQRRLKTNPRGRTLLKQELIDKGVDKDTVEQVVAELKLTDESDLALQIAEKRSKLYKRLPLHVARRRLHGYLARRGFESDTILRVIEQVI